MTKFKTLPTRLFALGKTQPLFIRIPKSLMKEVKFIGFERGWNQSDIIITALDQYVQHERKKRKNG